MTAPADSSPGPAVVFMLKHLELAKCPFNSNSIQCHPCPPTRSGGFSPDHGIMLCQDRFFNKKHMEDTLVHEMVHAFDHCRFDVKWDDLRHHACSEVRSSGALLQALADQLGRYEQRICLETAGGRAKFDEAFTHSLSSIK